MKGGIYMTIFLCLKRMMCICMIHILIFGVLFHTEEVIFAKESLNMYSGSYALMDADTSRVLYGKQEASPMANASTTKILTCIVALENCNLEEMVTISSYAASQPRVRMGMKEGEQYPLKDLIYGLMLESYNDCAVAIAEHVAGDTKSFAKLLNSKAKEIGCKDTYFITPNGLDAEDEIGFHHTTAVDLCRMMAYCTWESPKRDLFLEITQTRNYASFINRNAFLNQMEGVLTGKTGFTNKAGYCYVAAMEVNGERYCIALLACGWPNNKNYKWKDARTLFEYGKETYDLKKVIVKGFSEEMKVNGYVGNTKFTDINNTNKLKLCAERKEYQLLMTEEEKVTTELIIFTDTKLPIKKGQIMGRCNLYLDNVFIDSISLVATEKVNMWGWKENLYTIFYQFLTFSS